MKITYIHHSSFLVETEENYFLFDYFEGKLPQLKEDKPLLVFASHRHGDHFSPVIFDLVKTHASTGFVLSDDIWKRRVPEELMGKTYFIGPEEELDLQAPFTGPSGVKVHGFKSTDEGVAFLIETEGKRIYHAGDLNNWVWEGEPEADNKRMSQRFHQELEKLRGIHIDVAFMLLDPRQEDKYCWGMNYFLEHTDSKVVFPMHCFEHYNINHHYLNCEDGRRWKDIVRDITGAGQVFEI